jgi:NAD(P)H-dependent FMN reductase
MNILGFAGSNSPNSINKKLVSYALSLFEGHQSSIIDLNNYEVEIFRIDREIQGGIPNKILQIANLTSDADLLVISLAENNASYNAGFKNIYDWMSRIPNRQVFDGKPLLLMATSPGGRGGASVLEAAKERFPRDGAKILATFSLPLFDQNFNSELNRITDNKKNDELVQIVHQINLKNK